MFSAGLETDIKELKKSGKASFIIALLGVLIPLAAGFGIAFIFNRPELIESTATTSTFLQNMFIGVILTATSVSISVETLKEMGKLNTRAGNAILGAAIIDDILGIVALTIITSLADSSVNVAVVLLKIVAFFVVAIVAGLIFYKLFKIWTDRYQRDMRRFVIVAFVFCLVLSYVAEEFFGVADITGSFIAGLIISNTQKTKYIASRFSTLSYMLLSPMFFASIGLKVALPEMTTAIIVFSVILVIVACLTKVVGCGLGALLCRYTKSEAVQIGVGMISRGEVALIVANKGNAVGLMSANILGPIIIMVVATTIVAPIFLKIVFSSKHKDTVAQESELVRGFEELEKHHRDH